MFEGDFADMCTDKFIFEHAQTGTRTPIGTIENFIDKIVFMVYSTKFGIECILICII